MAKQQGHEHRTVYEGICLGGPMNGQQGQSRFPKGFVLVDKLAGTVVVYDYHAEKDEPVEYTEGQPVRTVSAARFIAREPDTLDDLKRLRAAEEFNYDVRAVSGDDGYDV